MELLDKLVDGDPRALARSITLVEEGLKGADELMRRVYPRTGQATVIGLTGSPGSGKSSLVDRLVTEARSRDRKVGVVAIDPSSAFSGGAILGDRIRMQDHAKDEGVFIRSMATRGHLGGLSRATSDAIDLMDAAGYDPILVETVGVGQDEIEVVRAADVVAVVLVPGMGDDIQAIKAGILEIADLFVINKADRPGADRLQAELDYMMSLISSDGKPKPEILQTVAVRNEGVKELLDGVLRFAESAAGRRRERRHERAHARFLAVLSERLLASALTRALPDDRLEKLVDDLAERRIDPYTGVEQVMKQVLS
ncbi:hypothetical protein ABI59_03580 [Acidobacteria bacterium Mor1]|nr:hypothetical protein ABI59_03580 [Acidobacteria bacterium Mor1]